MRAEYGEQISPIWGIFEKNIQGCSVVPIIAFGKAWFSGGLFGVSLELKAAVIQDEVAPEFNEFPL